MAIRIRRPKSHRALLERLCEGSGNPFNHLYEVLVFAGALGGARRAREKFDESDDSVRWEQFSGIDGAEELVDMLAAITVDEGTILSKEQEERRFHIFEEYANGGLGIIARAIEASPAKMTREVVLDLVLDEQDEPPPDIDLGSIADGLS